LDVTGFLEDGGAILEQASRGNQLNATTNEGATMKLKRMKTTMVLAALTAATASVPAAFGQGNDAILNLLVKKGVISQREANDIREQADADMAAAVQLNNKVKVPSFLSSLEWSGDLRLRAEYFSKERYLENDPVIALAARQEDQLRFRYRARFGVLATLQDWAKVGVRLASGNNDDPVSTNQNLTDTFSKKPIWFDLAYISLTPPALNWLTVTGGRMPNPIWQPAFNSPIVYDFDLNPEGISEQVSYQFGDQNQFRVFGNFGQWSLKEIGSSATDVFMFDSQVGLEAKMGKVKATVAGGYSATHNLKEMKRNGGGEPMSNSPNRGNLMDPSNGDFGFGQNNGYLDDFHVLHGRAEIAWTVSEKKFLGTPSVVTVSGEFDRNINDQYADEWHDNGVFRRAQDADQRTAFTGQLAFGNAKKQGEWSLAYQYKYLMADATFDALTDSDWGYGGTDRKGHVLKFAYNIRDWWQFGFTAFLTEKLSDRLNNLPNTTQGKRGEDLLRIQVDTVVKF